MPRRNRVDPFGRIVAHPARGRLMGNRGCLHDEAGRIVRASAATAWISCLPAWPGTCRRLMHPGRYTELFFLDEATALAAGHRPCGQCRADALAAFKRAWAAAQRLDHPPGAAEIDRTIRAEQRAGRAEADLLSLPDGVLVARRGSPDPWLVWRGGLRRWTFDGYRDPEPFAEQTVTAITPPSVIAAIAAGYDLPAPSG